MEEQEEIENARIILKNCIDRQESDFDYQDDYTIKLKVPPGSGALLVKNLYLSCESYMRGRMQNLGGSHNPHFTPGSPIEGYGVFRVVDSVFLPSGDQCWMQHFPTCEFTGRIAACGMVSQNSMSRLGFPKFLRAYKCKIAHGLESAPAAFVSLFIGENLGKVVISLEDDS